MTYITPSSDKSRHYDIIEYNGADITIYVTQEEFNRLLKERDYVSLCLDSNLRKNMVKDYIDQFPDCIHKNHPLKSAKNLTD
jgi:hypothetical protein